MSTTELSEGTIVDGRYRVGGRVRRRAGAVTYEAVDTSAQARVHLTAYDAACFPSPLVLERSLRELRQLQAVDDPRVAKVLASGKLEGGGVYEATAAVDGPTLADAAGPMPTQQVVELVREIGEALLAAQKAGVIHRNLGPDVVQRVGNAVILGGFAVGEPHGGPAFGPLETMAPEQAEGKVVDQRSLIYNVAALAQQLLSGRPLFAGDEAAKVRGHREVEVDEAVNPVLRRALDKDPRRRPMMLRQFLGDLAGIDGAAAPAAGGAAQASKPSTRGWTMFMDATEAGTAPAPTTPAPVAAASVPAPAPAPVAAAPVPVAPAATAAPAAKPSTRGWTMFMDAGEAGTAPPAAATPAAPTPAAPVPAPAPVPVAAAPAPAAPAATAAPAAKPSTRGWTMFMDAGEAGTAPAAAAAAAPTPAAPVPAPAPVAAAPVPTPTSPPTAGAPAAPKPSTRGWTMFMDAGDAAAPATPAATPAAATPTATATATPAALAPTPVAPAAAARPAAPTTPPAGPAAGPSTRGWTVFMDSGSPRPGDAPASTPAPPMAAARPTPNPGVPRAAAPVPVAASPTATPASGTPTPTGAPAPSPSTRGWTMFMEAPIQPQAAQPGAAAAPPTAAPQAAAPAARGGGASDAKGWTVYMEPGTAAPQNPNDPAGGKTIVAGGIPSMVGPQGGVTGRTVFAGGAPGEMPDTMYFKRGAVEPASGRRSVTRDEVPANVPAVAAEERRHGGEHGHDDALAPGRDAPIAKSGGSGKAVAVAVVGVVVVAAAAVALLIL